MRLKLLLIFLPLIVTVKTEPEDAQNKADPHPHDHVLMPFHEIPKPIPRPIYVQPLVPPKIVTEEPQPTVPPPKPTDPPTPTSEDDGRVKPRLPPAYNIPRPIPKPHHIGPLPDPIPPTTWVPPTRIPLRPTRPPVPTPLPTPIPKPEPIPEPQPKPIPEPKPEPQPKPTPKPPKPISTPRPPNPSNVIQRNPNLMGDTGIAVEYNCLQDGFYSVPNECDSYIDCYKRSAIKFVCPDGLHFNKHTRWPEYPCAYPSDEVKCELGEAIHEPQPTAQCPRQYGYFAIKDSDCSRYISCQEGLATILDCPPGLAFNDAKSACDWPANVPNCKPNVFKGFNCPPAPVDEHGQSSDWIQKYRYGKSCKEYIACQLGHPRLLSCDLGLFFDEESETCIDSDYVKDCTP